MRPDTLLQHIGEEERMRHAVTPPIFQTSLFVYETCEAFWEAMFDPGVPRAKHTYSRYGNPSLDVPQAKVAALEGTEASLLFTSGMAAISAAILSAVRQGGRIVYVDSIYGPAEDFITNYLPRYGVRATPVSGLDADELTTAIGDDAQAVYLESPSSLIFRLQDLAAVAAHCRPRGITTIVDNTYAAGFFQQPAKLGIDLVVQSASKFLGGHSDLVAGTLSGTKDRLAAIQASEIPWLGGALAPFPAWLLMRGMRTLGLRLRHSDAVAARLREYLRSRPEVRAVYDAADPESAQHDLFRRQMSGSVSLMSFEPHVQDLGRITAFVEMLKLFQIGVSWGGHESLAIPIPVSLAPGEEPRWLIRVYAGLDDLDDLFADLDRAFATLRP